MTEKAKKILTANSVKILDTFFFPRQQRDYTPIVTKVASINPDFFAMPGFGASAELTGLVAKALYDARWRGAWFVTAAPVIKDLTEICSRGETNGLYIPLTDFTTVPNPPRLASKVRKAFEEKYHDWREIGPYWTLPVWFFAASVQKANDFQADKVDKVLTRLEIETPIGKVRMVKRPDLNNMKFVDTIAAPGLAQIKGGKAAFIASMSIDEAIREMEKAYGFKGEWQ